MTQEIYTPGKYVGSRPLAVNKHTGQVQIQTPRGMTVNSLLRKDDWQLLDTDIQTVALPILNAVGHVRAAGLVKNLPNIGIMNFQYSQVGQMTAAETNMTGQGGERDRLDFNLKNFPIPITFKGFDISTRELAASRMNGVPLDTTHAQAASRVVAEALETMLINGNAAMGTFDGGTIFGYTTETNRTTSTAAALGGGDWGTISNIIPTIAGAINAAEAVNYNGPFNCYAATTQFNQATLARFADGSGEAPADWIRRLPQISGFYQSTTLADGVVLLVQMESRVVDWAEHMMVKVVEWMSEDGLMGHFKVIAVAAPRVKSDKDSQSGIVHVTGA